MSCTPAGLLPEGTWRRFLTLFAVALGLAFLNYFGLTIVGGVAVAMTAFIVVVFVLLCGFAAPHVTPANWLIMDLGAVRWGAFLNVMFWNTNYWDSCRRARNAPEMAWKHENHVTLERLLNLAVLSRKSM